MTPVMCRSPHRPPSSYGDCLRACIATVMDIDWQDVPHFADAGVSGAQSRAAARQWLNGHRLTVTAFAMPDEPLDAVLHWMETENPDTTWLLFGSTARPGSPDSGGDHVVVCQGGEVVHDPAWIPTSIKQVGSCGYWEIWVVSKL